MKKKGRNGGGESERGSRAPGTQVGSGPFKKQQQHKRTMKLGGGGLSLEAFAAAKTKPLITPSQIREHREFYSNAKKVQKYKKLVSQLGLQGPGPKVGAAAAPPVRMQDSEMANDGIPPPQKKNSTKPLLSTHGKQFKSYRKQPEQQKVTSQMEKTREQFQKKKFDNEEMRRREREEAFGGQQQAKEKAHDHQVKQVRLRKRTQCGQPVMKHQMELLLETIKRGS